MIVGFDSPMPPARTGVADYAAALAGALRRHGRTELKPSRADVYLYHLGNNQLHRKTYRRALARPGVTVLHDAVLQHFFLGSLTESEYAEEFVHNYGEWHRGLAHELWSGRAASGVKPQYFDWPMLKRIAETSRAVVVHNPRAARLVSQHAPKANVVEIPLLYAPPQLPPREEVLRFRQSLGLSKSRFVFAIFGYLRESKRVMTVLRAFESIRRARPDTALLIAGEFVSRDLARAVRSLLQQPGVFFTGHLGVRDFWLAACGIDACINLRYPTAGETSAVAVQMMGIGKPVMVTAAEETARYPEDACLRIDPGLAEKASLTEHGILAASFPQLSREIGERGAKHIHLHHSLDRVAEKYWETLCACAG